MTHLREKLIVAFIFIKGDSKFSARKASAKQVLAVFGKPGWQVVKESKFSPLVKSFATLRSEASAEGDAELMRKCDFWAGGLGVGKALCKASSPCLSGSFLLADPPSETLPFSSETDVS